MVPNQDKNGFPFGGKRYLSWVSKRWPTCDIIFLSLKRWDVIGRRTSIHNQISQLSPQKGVAEVTVTNAQHVVYMPSKNRYGLLRNAQVDPILSLAVTHAYVPYYSLLDKQTPGRPPIS